MENRFGFRDFVFVLLFVVFIVSVWLAMLQADRQTDALRSIQESLDAQTRDLSRLSESIGRVQRQSEQLTALERRLEPIDRLARIERLLRDGAAIDDDALAELDDEDYEPADVTADIDDVEPGEFEVGELNPFHRLLEAKQRDDYAYGGTLMNVFGAAPDRLTPIISADVYASMIQGYVLESLLVRNPETLEFEPWIARDWQVEQNADAWQAYIDERMAEPLTEDEVRAEPGFAALDDEAARRDYIDRRMDEGRTREQVVQEDDVPPAITIRFQIREGVRFSDGEPLTADDVVFTYNWIMNPDVEAVRLRVYYSAIKDVEKLGPYEVAFHFREPYFRAEDFAGGMDILPKHFYERFTPSEFNRHPALLMGSGPYRLPSPEGRRPQAGRPIELVRNPRYWGEQPGFDRLVWRIIETDSARLQTFLNRDIDSFPANPEQFDDLRADDRVMSWAQDFNFLTANTGYNYIGWNQKRRGRTETPFADVRVRRAMTHLIDRDRIVEDIYRGYARVTSSPFNPLSPQANPEIDPWAYDVARARELLAETGYRDRSGDGVIQGPDGEPFAFELNYPANSETYQQLALFVRDSLQRVGINVRPRPLEWQVLLERVKNTREFDAVMLGWSGSIENDPYQIFHSSGIAPPGDNSTSYANPEFDALVERARMTLDEDERRDMWHRIHEIFHDDQPYTFLTVRESTLLYDGRIANIHRTRLGLNPNREWYVPAEQQRR